MIGDSLSLKVGNQEKTVSLSFFIGLILLRPVMLMGTADRDYDGTRESEEDVSDATEVKLDYSARSLILDLQTDAENICRVEIAPGQFQHRVPVEQIEIYYRDSFLFTKLARTDWTGTKDALGRIIIRFNHAINTKELKIHCNYDDLDFLQRPINRAEFKNTPEKLVTVYQKIPARTETYTYDGMGNRTTEKILLRNEKSYDYAYYTNSNRLKNNGRYTYEYDSNGNLIKKTSTDGNEVWEYSYDLLNQLEQVKKNGTIVSSYIYDPNGFRVEKIGSQGTIHYVPLLNGEVGYRKEITNHKEYSFIYVGGQHLARVNGIIGGDAKKFYYANDHEGNGMIVTDENGNKVVERDFTPFGQRIDQAGHEGKFPDETEDGFTGKDWDEDIGLYYFNARWYDPEVGRFVSEDSVSDPNNPNEYVYGADNPIINIDPTGHSLDSALNVLNSVCNTMNLVAAIDPNAGEAASAFNSFISKLNSVNAFLKGADPVKGQKNIETTKDLVIIKDDKGNVKNVYKKEDMRNDFQKLAALQEDKTKADEAGKFETTVKDKYKDYFNEVKGNNSGATLIGLRGWGNGPTTKPDNENLKGQNTYDDMLLVLGEDGKLGAFSAVNFESTDAKGWYKSKGEKKTLTGDYNDIGDVTAEVNYGYHGDYQALWLRNNYPVKGTKPNGEMTFLEGIHIHKGGDTWTFSKGCITIYDGSNPNFSGQWDRFMSYFKINSPIIDPDTNQPVVDSLGRTEGEISRQRAGSISLMRL